MAKKAATTIKNLAVFTWRHSGTIAVWKKKAQVKVKKMETNLLIYFKQMIYEQQKE